MQTASQVALASSFVRLSNNRTTTSTQVFHPSMLDGQEINGQIAQLSPKAELAVAEFNRCFS